jgi:LDH2 family malate/lactate/ureidoglycolate dehydrogenase
LPVFAAQALREWLTAVFSAFGVPADAAALTASHLVRANLRGVDTHGMLRVASYVKMLRAGATNATPRLTCEDRGGMLVVDCDGALGQVGGSFALRQALAAGETRALVGVSIRNVGHLGALGLFLEEAAAAGFVGMMMQNGPPIMGLPGSDHSAIGNNPFAFSAPVRGGPPLVFDMAASEVAFGRIMDHARTGAPLQPGWALDGAGRPTTDAKEALRGMLLPAGGYKGIGLAMLVETFAGSLTGLHAAASIAPGQQLPSRFGGMLLLVNPAIVIGRDVFDAHLAEWLSRYKGSSGEARYPGEKTARLESERAEAGIPLPDAVVADLGRIGGEVGAPMPSPLS